MHELAVRSNDYAVWYEAESDRIVFEGVLRLNGAEEYAPITDLLEQVLARDTGRIHWDLKGLEFLNSSGINVFYKFIIRVRKQGGLAFKVVGNEGITWQKKSLPNMKKFMPELEIVME